MTLMIKIQILTLKSKREKDLKKGKMKKSKSNIKNSKKKKLYRYFLNNIK